MELTEAVIVMLEAARRPLTLYQIADECQPYVEETISYFDVKQICMSLFQQELVQLMNADPLTFLWL